MSPDAADTLGIDGRWFDPLWRITVELSPLEQALLDTWPVRRLGAISHAGAASLTTTQTYSRLEHSLGVLALVAHFAPEDQLARASALLHDVGHLPFSHTLEGIDGLDHHELGHTRVRAMGELLAQHGIDADDVNAVDDGCLASPLTSGSGGMKLDHLDSFLRSGQAHGRTRGLPSELLEHLRLRDGTVDTDPRTGAELVRLAVAEARAQRSPADVIPVAVLRHLVTTALTGKDPELSIEELTGMTDDELLAALRRCPSTAEEAEAFRRHPLSWRLLADHDETEDGPSRAARVEHRITRTYLDPPSVDGELLHSPEAEDLRRGLPLVFVLRRQ
ncbi:MAG: HD domain-containing protein [Brachybacterium tyrofermentans]|uniref:HD domain-containing protein n=1 Tax=Brachybacterium tyrofermentans TaxID=47848 RepID=UPI000A1A3AD4|nr:HD domain-containing protein [Brachybacterium tyrofermentans]SLM96229.1 Putative dNTP triphosphohydrolase, Archaeal subgroup [Corynebacterium xerosis]